MPRGYDVDIPKTDINFSAINGRRLVQIHYSVAAKASNSAKSELSTKIRAKLNLKKSDVDNELLVRADANFASLAVKSQRPLRLYKFVGTKQNKTGVSVKIFKSGARETLEHAFLQDMRGGFQYAAWRATPPYRVPTAMLPRGYVSYFARTWKTKRYDRLELTGPRIADIAKAPNIINDTIKKFDTVYLPELDRRLKLEIAKIK